MRLFSMKIRKNSRRTGQEMGSTYRLARKNRELVAE